MKATEQTLQQIERFINKIVQKYPLSEEDATDLTDLHILVSQESGEMLAFDDDDKEITRCVVEEWIDNKDERFYEHVTSILRQKLKAMAETIDRIGIIKPFGFILEDDDREHVAELYMADDETDIIDEELLKGWDKELDDFINQLLKE